MLPCGMVLVVPDYTRIRTFRIDGTVSLRLGAASCVPRDGEVCTIVMAIKGRDWAGSEQQTAWRRRRLEFIKAEEGGTHKLLASTYTL
jgi:hypothetical protein